MTTRPETNGQSIRIDKEGNWFYNGLPIVNKNIYLLFNRHIVQDPGGGYSLVLEGESCRLEVEDTPYVVTAFFFEEGTEEEQERIVLRLNDESTEILDPETLVIGKKHVPYCRVKHGAFPARILRPAYYDLARHIRQEGESRFYITLNSRRYYIPETTTGA